MEVIFRLHYATAYGEELVLLPAGSGDECVAMQWTDGHWWTCRMDLPAAVEMDYRYEVRCQGVLSYTFPSSFRYSGSPSSNFTPYQWLSSPCVSSMQRTV